MEKHKRDIIRNELSVLLGHRLMEVWCQQDLLGLEFGPEIEGARPKLAEDGNPVLDENQKPVIETAILPRFTIEADCFARFIYKGKVVATRNDSYFPAEALQQSPGFSWLEFNCPAEGESRLDELVSTTLAPLVESTDGFVVKKVTVSKYGDTSLHSKTGIASK